MCVRRVRRIGVGRHIREAGYRHRQVGSMSTSFSLALEVLSELVRLVLDFVFHPIELSHMDPRFLQTGSFYQCRESFVRHW